MCHRAFAFFSRLCVCLLLLTDAHHAAIFIVDHNNQTWLHAVADAFANLRKQRRWFCRKYFASVMNIREFFADNLGKDMADTISNALTCDISRRFVN
ncbi:MAG: hypothetical protein KH068_05905 [Prevotella sp.]|nr:hypothetical protein [Prevotella sp.]MBS7207918.1 hypothetical protein [Prevotella sp.]